MFRYSTVTGKNGGNSGTGRRVVTGRLPTAGVFEINLPQPGFIRSAE